MRISNKRNRPAIAKEAHRWFRRLGLSYASFYLTAAFTRLNCPEALSVEEAENLLQQTSPDNGRSALCENRIHRPEYDVQIVIPAYNASETLEECLDSVLCQKTHYSILTIVVDDGSTDRTPDLLLKYASYPNVRVIRQENKGFSGARNAGLKDIYARYVCFVDADDRLLPNAIEQLVCAADESEADITEGCFRKFVGEEILTAEQFPFHEGNDWTLLQGYPWGKVYKAALFAHICFPENYWFEDTVGVLLLYPQAQHIVRLPEIVYEYRQSSQGISQTSRGNVRSIDGLWVTRRLLNDAKEFGIQTNREYFDVWLNDIRNTLGHLESLQNDDYLRAALTMLHDLYQTFFPGMKASTPYDRALQQVLALHDPRLYRFFRRLL